MSAVSLMPKLLLSSRLTRLFLPAGASTEAALLTDEEVGLVERLRRADPRAIDELYRAHHSVLRSFALRLVGDEALAEDLVHDVFLQVPKLMRSFRAQSSLRSFLVGVAVQLGRRHVRAASRRRAAITRLAREERTPQRCDDAYERGERLALLQRALDTLSLEQRTAFVLCEVEERSVEEVASLLGVPEGTVRTRCFHARKKLTKALLRRTDGGLR